MNNKYRHCFQLLCGFQMTIFSYCSQGMFRVQISWRIYSWQMYHPMAHKSRHHIDYMRHRVCYILHMFVELSIGNVFTSILNFNRRRIWLAESRNKNSIYRQIIQIDGIKGCHKISNILLLYLLNGRIYHQSSAKDGQRVDVWSSIYDDF